MKTTRLFCYGLPYKHNRYGNLNRETTEY